MATWNNNIGITNWANRTNQGGKSSDVFNVSSLNVNHISSGSINTSNLYAYNATIPFLSNLILNTDVIALGTTPTYLTAESGILYVNGTAVSIPSSFSTIADWSRFKAVANVDMSRSSIYNVLGISTNLLSSGSIVANNINLRNGLSTLNISSGNILVNNINLRNGLSTLNISSGNIVTNNLNVRNSLITNNISSGNINVKNISSSGISTNTLNVIDLSANNITAQDIKSYNVSMALGDASFFTSGIAEITYLTGYNTTVTNIKGNDAAFLNISSGNIIIDKANFKSLNSENGNISSLSSLRGNISSLAVSSLTGSYANNVSSSIGRLQNFSTSTNPTAYSNWSFYKANNPSGVNFDGKDAYNVGTVNASQVRATNLVASNNTNTNSLTVGNGGTLFNSRAQFNGTGNFFSPYWYDFVMDANVTTANGTTIYCPTNTQYFSDWSVNTNCPDAESITSLALTTTKLHAYTAGLIIPTGYIDFRSHNYRSIPILPPYTLKDYRGQLFFGTEGSGPNAYIGINYDSFETFYNQGTSIILNADSAGSVDPFNPVGFASRITTQSARNQMLGTLTTQIYTGYLGVDPAYTYYAGFEQSLANSDGGGATTTIRSRGADVLGFPGSRTDLTSECPSNTSVPSQMDIYSSQYGNLYTDGDFYIGYGGSTPRYGYNSANQKIHIVNANDIQGKADNGVTITNVNSVQGLNSNSFIQNIHYLVGYNTDIDYGVTHVKVPSNVKSTIDFKYSTIAFYSNVYIPSIDQTKTVSTLSSILFAQSSFTSSFILNTYNVSSFKTTVDVSKYNEILGISTILSSFILNIDSASIKSLSNVSTFVGSNIRTQILNTSSLNTNYISSGTISTNNLVSKTLLNLGNATFNGDVIVKGNIIGSTVSEYANISTLYVSSLIAKTITTSTINTNFVNTSTITINGNTTAGKSGIINFKDYYQSANTSFNLENFGSNLSWRGANYEGGVINTDTFTGNRASIFDVNINNSSFTRLANISTLNTNYISSGLIESVVIYNSSLLSQEIIVANSNNAFITFKDSLYGDLGVVGRPEGQDNLFAVASVSTLLLQAGQQTLISGIDAVGIQAPNILLDGKVALNYNDLIQMNTFSTFGSYWGIPDSEEVSAFRRMYEWFSYSNIGSAEWVPIASDWSYFPAKSNVQFGGIYGIDGLYGIGTGFIGNGGFSPEVTFTSDVNMSNYSISNINNLLTNNIEISDTVYTQAISTTYMATQTGYFDFIGNIYNNPIIINQPFNFNSQLIIAANLLNCSFNGDRISTNSLSSGNLYAGVVSSLQMNASSINCFRGSIDRLSGPGGATTTGNLFPSGFGAQLGYFGTSGTNSGGFYNNINVRSTNTTTITPDIVGVNSNIIRIQGFVSSQQIFTSSIFARANMSTQTTITSNILVTRIQPYNTTRVEANYIHSEGNVANSAIGSFGRFYNEGYFSNVFGNALNVSSITPFNGAGDINSTIRVLGTLSTQNQVVSSIRGANGLSINTYSGGISIGTAGGSINIGGGGGGNINVGSSIFPFQNGAYNIGGSNAGFAFAQINTISTNTSIITPHIGAGDINSTVRVLGTLSTQNQMISSINLKQYPYTSTLNIPFSTFAITGTQANNPILLYSNVDFRTQGFHRIAQKAILSKNTGGTSADIHANIFYSLGSFPSTPSITDGYSALPYINQDGRSSFTTCMTELFVSTPTTRNIYYYDSTANNYTARLYMGSLFDSYTPSFGLNPERIPNIF